MSARVGTTYHLCCEGCGKRIDHGGYEVKGTCVETLQWVAENVWWLELFDTLVGAIPEGIWILEPSTSNGWALSLGHVIAEHRGCFEDQRVKLAVWDCYGKRWEPET